MSEQLLKTASTHNTSLVGIIDSAFSRAMDAVASVGWTPLARLAESGVVALMQRITVGHLRVLTESHIYNFPALGSENAQDGPSAELRVVKDSFWIRLVTMSDLGFAEAFMYGDVECDDLVALFKIFLLNRENLVEMKSTIASLLFTLPQRLTSTRFLNTLSNSRSNISAHYDISNQMFEAFLSRDMTYSCAIFPTLDADMAYVEKGERLLKNGVVVRGLGNGDIHSIGAEDSAPVNKLSLSNDEDELYQAQLIKLDHLVKKLKIPETSDKTIRVLEIGSGWGALAILLTQKYPFIEVDSLTLSSEQKSLAEERISEAGVEARVRIWLMDYRCVPESWTGVFDRFVSVEMIEAVGREFLTEYWAIVERCMKPKNSVGVVQVITIPEPRYERYIQEIDFIRKWVSKNLARSAALYLHKFHSMHIFRVNALSPCNRSRVLITGGTLTVFPGGHLPTVTALVDTLAHGGKNKLIIDSISNIGPHYARTLREWRKRFLARFDSDIIPSLKREYPEVFDESTRGRNEIEVFKRKWVYYYCYCEVGFTTRTLGDHILTFVREGFEGNDLYNLPFHGKRVGSVEVPMTTWTQPRLACFPKYNVEVKCGSRRHRRHAFLKGRRCKDSIEVSWKRQLQGPTRRSEMFAKDSSPGIVCFGPFERVFGDAPTTWPGHKSTVRPNALATGCRLSFNLTLSILSSQSSTVSTMKGFFTVATTAIAVLANVGSSSARSNDLEKRITHYGQMTWFNPVEGNDGCNYKVPKGAPAVHVSSTYWRGGENCGQWVDFDVNGKRSYGVVTGECKTCSAEGIDTAPILFTDFAHQDVGLLQCKWKFMKKGWAPADIPECDE
ncbi:unnamed protein product [Rhizoctonia solani]|uniref:Cyclopropane-fatty-acyl-phospholipid synthase n=1 Tax=Rhizoctonia solani TaxID=456999 RepID=A0A8H3CGF5_9AGAM|nr:unnamed protein product [Rhizoctonia solani]